MQVFISWSGEQSNAVAVALREWLPKVLAARITPFVSSEDIDKGARGLARIATELEESKFGIVVVTPSNVGSTWINFEAGSLGKAVGDSKVAPLLVGLADADLDGPLKQFQNASANDQEAVRKLVLSINKAHPDPLDQAAVSKLFDSYWDELEAAIGQAMSLGKAEPAKKRTSDDILDEVLTTVRALQREVANLQSDSNRDDWRLYSRPSDQLAFRQLREKPDWTRRLRQDKVWSAHELLTMILRAVGADFQLLSDGRSIEVQLADGTAQLGPDFLKNVQAIAASHQIVITMTRSDSSGVRFDEGGVEFRRGAEDDEFTSRSTPGEPV